MSLLKTKEEIFELLDSDRLSWSVKLKYKANLLKGLEIVFNHFDNMENEIKFEVTDEEIRSVRSILDNLKHMLFGVVVTEQLSDLVKKIVLVIHNWNKNTVDHTGIDIDCKFVSNAVDNHYTMLDLFQALKLVNEQLQQKTYHSALPTDLSRHFLQALDDMYAEDSCE